MEMGVPPDSDEFEFTLIGPGYGESIILHLGGGVWVLVDSNVDKDGNPRSLQYLESIGCDPAQSVALIVATHWHDDHIRGMEKMVKVCSSAKFCCSNVLSNDELLATISALESRHLSVAGSGAQEIHRVLSWLLNQSSKPTLAIANRLLYAQDKCEIWSFTPSDSAILKFMRSIGNLLPREGQGKSRIPNLYPNDAAVVLLVKVGNFAVLLGSDLERPGWLEILENRDRPSVKASVFKVPHHGSENANEPGVWEQMLKSKPFAALTPWHRGGHTLPRDSDVQRLLSNTNRAYSSVKKSEILSTRGRKSKMVERTLKESAIKLYNLPTSHSAVRLRRPLKSNSDWSVEMFGSACHLKDFANGVA